MPDYYVIARLTQAGKTYYTADPIGWTEHRAEAKQYPSRGLAYDQQHRVIRENPDAKILIIGVEHDTERE